MIASEDKLGDLSSGNLKTSMQPNSHPMEASVRFFELGQLKNNVIINIVVLLVSTFFLAPALGPVPSSNENIYLLFMAKIWDPTLFVRDWTFAGPFYGHWIFSYIFGFLTLLFSWEVAAWLGRFLSWVFIFLGLFQLGRQFQIPLWMITVAIFLWLLYQQSLVGGEWIVGTFEAKCIAYVCLFFALSALMQDRDLIGSFLLGLCFTFHGVIGMWALLGVGLSVLYLRYRWTRLLKMAGCVLVAAAPGLIVTLPIFSGDWTLSQDQAKFFVLMVAPFHLDPLSFPKRDVALLLVLFVFHWLTIRSTPANKALRFLNCFLISLGLFYFVGVVARLSGFYGFLLYYPFRLFPVLVPLLFFFSLMNVCYNRTLVRSTGPWLLTAGILALLSLPGALGQIVQESKFHYRMWATYYDWDDLQKCFLWVRDNTPNNAIVILPPWKKESFYLTKRATIAHWATPRMDRFQEWRERIAALVGEFSPEDEHLGKTWEEYYNSLSEEQIGAIVSKYGGEYLVSEGSYDYPILYDAGTYKVYLLAAKRTGLAMARVRASN